MTQEQVAMTRSDCRLALAGLAPRLAELRGKGLFVTGGTGFVGTWVAESVAYLNDECDFGTTLYLLARSATELAERAPHLGCRGDLRLVSQDVRRGVELPHDVEYIIHAAASPDNRVHASDPITTVDVIVNGTKAVLSAALLLPRIRRILNMSSGQVYADPEATGAGALSPYVEAKRCAEALCGGYRSLFRLPIVTARPFTFVGPYQGLDKPWAINSFLHDALGGSNVRILGNPETQRSYLYGSDVAVCLLALLVSECPGVCDVGSPFPVTLGALAEKVARYGSASSQVRYPVGPGASARATKFLPSASSAEFWAQLGVSPSVGLDDAIGRTLRWHRG